jgi:dCTP deaminase
MKIFEKFLAVGAISAVDKIVDASDAATEYGTRHGQQILLSEGMADPVPHTEESPGQAIEGSRGGRANTASASIGILPSHGIRAMVAEAEIIAEAAIEDAQVQPASLDLRLANVAYRIRASFLPGPDRKVTERLEDLSLHKIDLTAGAVLETGCVYLVPLMESLALPERVNAAANPKSSTGRLDVFTRLITDGAVEFDKVPAGYNGPLFAEISPRTFSVLVRAGSRLNQIRFRRGTPIHSDSALQRLHDEVGLVDGDAVIDNGLALSVDLRGANEASLIGYRAKRHAGLIDVDRPAAYEVDDFWEPLAPRVDGALVLDPDEFYILASQEAVHVPPTHAAEMVPYNPLVGEFRVHYAGFFDPGFGHARAGGSGSKAVLEVRSHDVPFILTHGQTVGHLVYEKLMAEPAEVYGQKIGSHYQRQGLKLSKHFRKT